MTLSTNVDKKRIRAPRVPASEQRMRIVAAARLAFSRAGFDQTGLREIGAEAGVDPAIIIRLFESKENLFAAAADGVFALEAPFEGPVSGLGLRIARHLMSKRVEKDTEAGFDEFHFLLRSAASPKAAPLLAAALHAGFIGPLATLVGGRAARARAAVLTSCILGFATLRVALGSPLLEENPRAVTDILARALQACIDP